MARDELTVEVAYSPRPSEVFLRRVVLASGATVRHALDASGVWLAFPALASSGLKVGIWGKVRALDAALRDGDRVEVYRPLQVDPKEARRQRYRSHRQKAKAR